VYVPCEVCAGKRYNRETLEVKYKNKSIADVLEMNVEDAVEFFKNIPKIHRKLETLLDVGLGYIKLGQPATTLSGGEAQRVKLASELYRRSTGKTIYILDEPTTGLHVHDIDRLLKVLHRLVDSGETVLVIEHNLDVIKTADYVIDLGPEGGSGGGTIIATGTPEQIVKVDTSYTGRYLGPVLERDKKRTAQLEEIESAQVI
jgi:excinuclease ABC subunit A